MNKEPMTHAEWIEQLYKMDRARLVCTYMELLDDDERYDLLSEYLEADGDLSEQDIIGWFIDR